MVQEVPHALDELVVALHTQQDVPEFDAHVAVFVEKADAQEVVPFGDGLVVHELTVVDVDRLAEPREERFFVVELPTAPCGLCKDVDIDLGILGQMQTDGGRCGAYHVGKVWRKDLFEAKEGHAQVVVRRLMREIRPQRVTQVITTMAHLGVGKQEQKQVDGALCAPAWCGDWLAIEMASKCAKGLYVELGGGDGLVQRARAGGGCKFHMNPP